MRVEAGPTWPRWAVWGSVVIIIGVISLIVASRFVLPALDDEQTLYDNRTWLEYAWTTTPINQDAIRQLTARLEENRINRIYLEAAAWRNDGTLLEGEYVVEFVEGLRGAYPEIEVLLWLRMSGEEIAQPEPHANALELAGKAIRDWQFDGIQLNGRTVINGSESYIRMLRDLRSMLGSEGVLSVTVPPDRIPFDPEVPSAPTVDPALTWDVDYKQRVGLLMVDEAVIMAHASGLETPDDYTTWVAYQIASYAEALDELDRPPEIVVALPTYDTAPEHDPAIEEVRTAIRGVRDGIDRAGKAGDLIKGVGLFEYKTTDSLEWAYFREDWLGLEPE